VNDVKEKPILMRGEMVRAILDGGKTQTRRIVKRNERGLAILKRPYAANVRDGVGLVWTPAAGEREQPMPPEKIAELCPYGSIGERLWVRETWQAVPIGCHRDWRGIPEDRFRTVCPGHETVAAIYRADGEMPGDEIWQPSIFMPRWACRISLEITDVRVERLNDISEEDGLAEGFTGRAGFLESWGKHNKPEVTSTNPWVWIVGFKPAKGGA
jgi:hypothetical protein